MDRGAKRRWPDLLRAMGGCRPVRGRSLAIRLWQRASPPESQRRRRYRPESGSSRLSRSSQPRYCGLAVRQEGGSSAWALALFRQGWDQVGCTDGGERLEEAREGAISWDRALTQN